MDGEQRPLSASMQLEEMPGGQRLPVQSFLRGKVLFYYVNLQVNDSVARVGKIM